MKFCPTHGELAQLMPDGSCPLCYQGRPKLPASVKIGYRVYRIVALSSLQAAAKGRYGECSHLECEIRIDLTPGPREAANTLLHEILHAVWYVQHLTDADNEERTVLTLADGLSCVWVDNPEVMAWIAEHHHQ